MMVRGHRLVCAEECQGGELHNCAANQLSAFIPLDFVYIWEDRHICPEDLESSLRKVLNLYPAVAGRVADGNRLSLTDDGHTACKVVCTNEGVGFEVVEASGCARSIASMEDGPKRGIFTSYPNINHVIAGKAPILTVKLTLFKEGGCALGMVANHIVFDGWTFAMFMRDWSEVHNDRQVQATVAHPPPEMMRIATPDAVQAISKSKGLKCVMKGLIGKAVLKILIPLMFRQITRSPVKRSILHFTDEELSVLKQRAEAEAGTWISTNEALLAHLHPLMLDAFGVPADACVGAAVPINVRNKLSGVSSRAIGNYAFVVPFSYDLHGPKGGPARAVHEAMREELSERELQKVVELNNYSMTTGEIYMPEKFMPGTPGFIQQWNYQATTPYFDVDFGAGAPDRALPWALEPVKVMRGPRGGLDVMVHQGAGIGLHDWVRNPFRHVAVGAGLAASVSCHVGIVGICVAVRRAIAVQHNRRVQSCFVALENHPNLKSFMKEVAALGA
jgi:hypothetical protein